MVQQIQWTELDRRDALDLAILMEADATERYLDFVNLFEEDANREECAGALEFFKKMAASESRHHDQLAALRYSLVQHAPRRVNPSLVFGLEAPQRVRAMLAFGAEAGVDAEPRVLVSTRQALKVALAAERRALDFFATAVRQSTDPQVRLIFEQLRDEEAEHCADVARLLSDLPPSASGDDPLPPLPPPWSDVP